MSEEFDEEGVEGFEEEVPVVVPDLVHEISGIKIGFRRPKRGQLVALSRVRDSVSRELFKLQRDTELDSKVRFEKASRLVMSVDLAILDMVESMIIEEGDKSFLANALITGGIDIEAISDVLFGNNPEPDDDAEPIKAVAKKAPRKVAARKVANAKRTRN